MVSLPAVPRMTSSPAVPWVVPPGTTLIVVGNPKQKVVDPAGRAASGMSRAARARTARALPRMWAPCGLASAYSAVRPRAPGGLRAGPGPGQWNSRARSMITRSPGSPGSRSTWASTNGASSGSSYAEAGLVGVVVAVLQARSSPVQVLLDEQAQRVVHRARQARPLSNSVAYVGSVLRPMANSGIRAAPELGDLRGCRRTERTKRQVHGADANRRTRGRSRPGRRSRRCRRR